jgi:hypothetical protein
MNGQLPPTDPLLRRQLARRSSGRLPENLLAETFGRLDAVPVRPRWLVSAPAAHLPRLAWGAAAVAAAALLAVAVVLPALHTTPAGFIAGYPAERALTVAELEELMAGPALAPNTAIVVTATIEFRSDICLMNRYPTIGVIEGTKSQVCVMGYDAPYRPDGERSPGTFAFRYIAPGYLGLLAPVTSAQPQLAFSVAEEWPLAGLAFLVEGYLGSTAVPCATETEAPGDVLSPNGYEQCRWSWLSDDGSPAAVQSLPTWSPPPVAAEPTPGPSIDLLGLDGKARHVEAGGARIVDSIPAATTHGVFVVRAVTGPCPGAAPYDSRGCAVWRVLARVPELSLSRPTPSATPSPTPASLVTPDGLLGAGNEPLTLGEVVELMQADPQHLAGWTVVLDAPFGSGVACPDGGTCAALKDLLESQGTWAVRIQSDGLFGIMGEVKKGSGGKLVSSLSEVTGEQQGYLRVVDAWLHAGITELCDTPAGPSDDVIDCALTEQAWLTPDGTDLSATRIQVQTGAYSAFVGAPSTSDFPPYHALYLVESAASTAVLSRLAREGSEPGGPDPQPPRGADLGRRRHAFHSRPWRHRSYSRECR